MPMLTRFPDPTNWYWIVGSNKDKVWSSASMSYVPSNDEGYKTWGSRATVIDSVSSLLAVLQQYVFPIYYYSKGVEVRSTTSPLNGTYAIDTVTLQNIQTLSSGLAAGKPVPGGGTTFNYTDLSGMQHSFTAENFIDFATAIENYIYNITESTRVLLSGGEATIPSNVLNIA